MLKTEDWDIDPWLADTLAKYEKQLDALLTAPPTAEELAFEGALCHLDEALWLRLGLIVDQRN